MTGRKKESGSMKTQRWKKWAMALAITGILIMQVGFLPVQAAEQQETDTVVETEIMEESAMETSNGPSEETAEELPAEGSEELHAEILEEQSAEISEEQEVVAAQATGITWTVDGDTMVITGEGFSNRMELPVLF